MKISLLITVLWWWWKIRKICLHRGKRRFQRFWCFAHTRDEMLGFLCMSLFCFLSYASHPQCFGSTRLNLWSTPLENIRVKRGKIFHIPFLWHFDFAVKVWLVTSCDCKQAEKMNLQNLNSWLPVPCFDWCKVLFSSHIKILLQCKFGKVNHSWILRAIPILQTVFSTMTLWPKSNHFEDFTHLMWLLPLHIIAAWSSYSFLNSCLI